MKAANKVNEKTGDFICGGTGKKGCGCDVGLGVALRGIVFCTKCANTLKLEGKRKAGYKAGYNTGFEVGYEAGFKRKGNE